MRVPLVVISLNVPLADKLSTKSFKPAGKKSKPISVFLAPREITCRKAESCLSVVPAQSEVGKDTSLPFSAGAGPVFARAGHAHFVQPAA